MSAGRLALAWGAADNPAPRVNAPDTRSPGSEASNARRPSADESSGRAPVADSAPHPQTPAGETAAGETAGGGEARGRTPGRARTEGRAAAEDEVRGRVLDAAERLFYGQGVQAVGMDAVRTASGVTLRRLYQLFPSKSALVEAYLARRDERWREALAQYVAASEGTPQERVLAVFDWLARWFTEDGFRGCAFINSYGELGATSPEVAEAARHHKDAFRAYIGRLTEAAGAPPATATHIALLAEGAITTAAISDSPAPAEDAKRAARILLAATTSPSTDHLPS
ncbi:TetR/AcrR family transcriptional regulator [Spirillospora sp. NPDC052269]